MNNEFEFEIMVVLVRSIYESNVGASSRAMSNYGVDKLILIDPKCEIGLPAHQAAATGQKGLESRRVYNSWTEFLTGEPDGIRISLTTRDGRGRQVRDLAETLQWIRTEHPLAAKQDKVIPVYLIFGPEDWGLSSADLELTHFACSIPTFGTNNSLNLAQAVLLALYTLRLTWGGQKSRLEGSPHRESSIQAPSVFPEETLKRWLIEMGFRIDHSRINVFTVLRRMLLQNVPSKKELVILETVLQQSIRKLREYNEMRKVLSPANTSKTETISPDSAACAPPGV